MTGIIKQDADVYCKLIQLVSFLLGNTLKQEKTTVLLTTVL